MKLILTLAIAIATYSCAPQPSIQADIVDATLIDVQTEHRYPHQNKKLLTWKTSNDLTIVTFAPKKAYYPLGTRMKMILPK